MNRSEKMKILSVGCNVDNELLSQVMPYIELIRVKDASEIDESHEVVRTVIWSNAQSLGAGELQRLSNLRYIVNWGTSRVNIAHDVMHDKKYDLMFIDDYCWRSVADFAMKLISDGGRYEAGKSKVGIIGLGKVGFSLAQLLLSKGAKRIYYTATQDKELENMIFMTQKQILSECDIVVAATSSPKRISLAGVDNPRLTLINLCWNSLFSAGELDKLLLDGKIGKFLSDTEPIQLKSGKAKFFGHIAYRSPESIRNKHNKLAYLVKIMLARDGKLPINLYFLRHGETEKNKKGIYQGREDSPLTELGRNQARRSADFLTTRPIKHVFTSPLGRARSTADILSSSLGVKPEVCDFLAEQNFGALQGMQKTSAGHKYEKFLTRRKASAWYKLYTPYPGGGESYFDVYNRVHDPYVELLAGLDGDAVFVGHESVNRILRGISKCQEPLGMIMDRQDNDQIVELKLADLSEKVHRFD